MRCWLSSERTTNPSSRRKRQDSLSLSLVLFPPKPLRWVSAGALLGAVIKTPVLHFFGTSVWGWYHYPRRALHTVETLDARGSRRLICRFYATAVLALCGQNIPSSGIHATPAPNRAHSGSHGETRGKTRSRPSRGGSAGLRCCAWEAFTPAFPRPSFQSSPTGSAFLPVSSPCCREPCALSCSQCAGMFQTDPIHYPVFPCR